MTRSTLIVIIGIIWGAIWYALARHKVNTVVYILGLIGGSLIISFFTVRFIP